MLYLLKADNGSLLTNIIKYLICFYKLYPDISITHYSNIYPIILSVIFFLVSYYKSIKLKVIVCLLL